MIVQEARIVGARDVSELNTRNHHVVLAVQIELAFDLQDDSLLSVLPLSCINSFSDGADGGTCLNASLDIIVIRKNREDFYESHYSMLNRDTREGGYWMTSSANDSRLDSVTFESIKMLILRSTAKLDSFYYGTVYERASYALELCNRALEQSDVI